MNVTTTEIAPDIFRLSIAPPGSPVNFGCFLVRDEHPAMVETGMRSMFPLFREAVAQLVDPASIEYLVIPHFEMDECGSLNEFLTVAPGARPVCTPVGSLVTLPDFTAAQPLVMRDGEALQLGRKNLRFILAPWVHFWDSMVVYDETDRLLFTSDLFMQTGDAEPMTDEDRSEAVVECCRFFGLLPSQRHVEALLAKLDPLPVDTIACHHGSVLNGDPQRYYRALRRGVGDIVDAPFYSFVPEPGQIGP